MNFFDANFHWITLGLSAFVLAAAAFLFFRRNKKAGQKGVIGIQHLVTLNSGGWLILSIVAAAGAFVMIGSSIAIGVDYWAGLAINADMTAGRITEGDGFFAKMTVGVISFFVLAIFFELMSDLGTPLSSGFRQRRNVALANFVIIATVGCVFMSLVTKWGYYDDKANVRRVQGAKITVEDQNWNEAKAEAEGVIVELKDTPSASVADARSAAADAKIAALKSELADAKKARDAIPESHSTNRIAAGREVSRINGLLTEAQEEKVAVAILRDDIQALAAAEKKLEKANAEIEKNAGLVGSSNEGGHEPAGDWLFVRLTRVALHQFLCWLFPLVFFESLAAHGDTLKKERANRARSQTMKDKANTIDAEPVDLPPRDPLVLTAAGYWQEKDAEDAAEKRELKRRKDKRSGTPFAPGYRNGAEEDGPEEPETAEDAPDEPGEQGALDDR